MRPTDEHQTGSTRPNFMSAARRGNAGDDNILARLERDAKRARSAKGGHSWMSARLAWCALAGVAVIGLVGVLASLAQENVTVHRRPALAAPAPEPLTSEPHSSPPVKGGFAPLPEPALSRAAAAIVEEQFKPAPMVMVKEAQAPAPRAEAPTRRAEAPAATPKRAAKPARVPAPIAPARTLAAAALARPVPRAINALPARQRKPAASAPAASDATVDSDVALISAIILHSSRHADERAQVEAATRCGSAKKCPAPADTKATD